LRDVIMINKPMSTLNWRRKWPYSKRRFLWIP